MKNCIFCLFVLACFFANAQNAKFGRITQADFDLKTYEKDTTANAVVLFEKGNYYFSVIQQRIQLVKEYHIRIKILNDEGVDEANIAIPLYRNDSNLSEVLENLEAVTHNGSQKMVLPKAKMYDVDVNEYVTEKRFTFSDVRESSIIEYKYKLISPFIFNLDGWTFQSDLPKIYSEFKAKIPGNYVYNRALRGTLKLDEEDAKVEKDCFYVPGYPNNVPCEVVTYSMKDIPAIEKNEKFMLAESNYVSRIEFELSESIRMDGTRNRYTKSWKDVDIEFRKDKDVGRQLKKKDYFEKNVPLALFNDKDELQKAKNIYKFVQEHFTWNKKYSIYRNVRVKEAFQNRLGNVAEINISLINLLNAGGIKTDIMMLSTRQNGLPKKIYPVISDFNYVVAKTTINGKDYLLDATSKVNPFGMLPFRCLNIYGRVMDFDKESYWFNIIPEKANRTRVIGIANFDLEEGAIKGKMRHTNQGYHALSKYEKIHSLSEEEYIDEIEGSSTSGFYIDDYEFQKDKSDEKKVMEVFEFTIEDVENNSVFYFNPLLVNFHKKSPFLRDERHFPVDFGFPRQFEYNMTFNLPEGYTIESLPEAQSIALQNNDGSIEFSCAAKGNSVTVRYQLRINATHFVSESYADLKKFFEMAVDIEQNSLIKLVRQ